MPNYDAVKWYVENIAYDIYKETNLKTHIVGKWNEAQITSLSSEAVVFEGFVEDLKLFSRKSLSISPVRIGSGIRTKILYAMAQ